MPEGQIASNDHQSWKPMAAEVNDCPKEGCTGKRYQPENPGASSPRRKPNKLYHYFNPIKQLCNRIWWRFFEKKLEPFPEEPTPEDMKVPHVHYAKICDRWRHFVKKMSSVDNIPKFVNGSNVVLMNGIVLFLSLCSDGFDPFNGVMYSMSFIALRIMSYTNTHGFVLENLILVGITQGPSKSVSLQPYLRMLVSDLDLLSKGVLSVNPNNPLEMRIMYAILLVTIADYPGHGEIHDMEAHSSANGCYKCGVKMYKRPGAGQMCHCRFRDLLSIEEDDNLIDAMGNLIARKIPRESQPTGKTKCFVQETVKNYPFALPRDGVKGLCELAKLGYYPFIECLAIDSCHTGRRQVKNIATALKCQTSHKAPIEPVLKLGENMTETQKKKAKKEHKQKMDNWHTNMELHATASTSLRTLGLTPIEQRRADIRYRWATMPGYSDSRGFIFQRTGDIDIHDALQLLCTGLLLYSIYPYCDPVLYGALVGLVEIWGVIIDPDTTVEQLKKFRPELDQKMAVWESVGQFSVLNMLFHVTGHIFDFRGLTGPAQGVWMFHFERLVSLLIRMIKNRATPEVNLCNNWGLDLFLNDSHNSIDGAVCAGKEDSNLTEVQKVLLPRMLESLSLKETDESIPFGPKPPPYTIPNKLRQYKANLVKDIKKEVLAYLTTTPPTSNITTKLNPTSRKLSRDFLQSASKEECEIYQYDIGSKTINGLGRATVKSEPSIGSLLPCVRRSGFSLLWEKMEEMEEEEEEEEKIEEKEKEEEVWNGQVMEYYIVNKSRLYVMVAVYPVKKHSLSSLHIAETGDRIIAIVPAEWIGCYRVFCPWTERGADDVSTDRYCVLSKSKIDSRLS